MYTLQEKYQRIKAALLQSTSRDPIAILEAVMHTDFVNMHGPEHHFLDGGALLAAYRNAGGDIDLAAALDLLRERSAQMPGAMCGLWGVCGAAASVGAALSVIHQTGPLSGDDFYKDHMACTSAILQRMSEIGGPRCCKRNALIALSEAATFMRKRYGADMEASFVRCDFSAQNRQCLHTKCPFYAAE